MQINSEFIAPALSPASDHGRDAKALATLIAAFALSGFAVHRLPSGGYAVNRWNLSRYCADLSALQAFGRQVGARL